jgi:hypothetical protein
MGKRELLIAAAFICLAAIVYQITAPAPKDGEGFSLRRAFDGLRREIRSESARGEFKQTGTIPVGAAVQEIRLNSNRSVPVTIEGEDRADIAYEMPVQSTGPDADTALGYAKRSIVEVEDLGSQLALSTWFPAEGSQNATLTLKVPARLAVRLDAAGRPKVRGVASVRLNRISGELVVEDIRGAVTGTHLNGDLTVNKAGSVNLILISSRIKLGAIERGVTANIRGGECEVRESKGPLAITANGTRLSVFGHDGAIDIDGETGQIRVDRPLQPAHIDIRRASVNVTLAAAASVVVITSESHLQLNLEGTPAILLDAAAWGGKINAEDFSLEPETSERGARLKHEFGGKAARVTLRNSRGDIVIARAK